MAKKQTVPVQPDEPQMIDKTFKVHIARNEFYPSEYCFYIRTDRNAVFPFTVCHAPASAVHTICCNPQLATGETFHTADQTRCLIKKVFSLPITCASALASASKIAKLPAFKMRLQMMPVISDFSYKFTNCIIGPECSQSVTFYAHSCISYVDEKVYKFNRRLRCTLPYNEASFDNLTPVSFCRYGLAQLGFRFPRKFTTLYKANISLRCCR